MWRGHAFGVELEASEPVPGAIQRSTRSNPPKAQVHAELARAATLRWPRSGWSRLVSRDLTVDQTTLTVDHHPAAGWRIEAAGYGLHIIDLDARRLSMVLPQNAERARRLLVAQVLPMLGVLNGRSAYHASGTVVGTSAAILLGPSGAGKSTVAAMMLTEGATHLADDVVACSIDSGRVVAHAGSDAVRLDRSVLDQVLVPEQGALRVRSDIGDKAQVTPSRWAQAREVRHVVVLATLPAGKRVVLRQRRVPVDVLLGAAFFPHLGAGAPARQLLRTTARLAETTKGWSLEIPLGEARLGARALTSAMRHSRQ